MSKFTDTIKAALKSYFETGDQPTESQFAEMFNRIQQGIQEHGHTASGGAESGTGDAGPVINLQSGTAAAKPANPEVGDIYVETDTSKVYACYSAGNWTEVTGGEGGAPTDASYVTVNPEAGLSAETQHKNITGADLHDPKAHASNHENGGGDEISVAGLSGELADDQPPKAHDLGGSKHNAATLAQLNAKVSDAALDDASDPRDPNAHAANHEDGGGDEISVAGLSGVLADKQDANKLQGRDVAVTAPSANQVLGWDSGATQWEPQDPSTPGAHAASHENGGGDEISVAGLSGELADDQPPKAHGLGGSKHSNATLAQLNAKVSDATLDDAGDARDPNAHAANHEDGGGDEISVAGLSGELADDQPPKAHDLGGAKHNAATLAQLNAKVSDATLDDASDSRDPNAHAASHAKDASDELQIEDLSTGAAADGEVFQADGLGGGSWGGGGGGGFYDAYVCVRDKKTQDTDSGTFTMGAWRTRDINEEQADTADICSIASNQITLPAGTYRCHISAPAYAIKRHQMRLFNVTDSSVVLVGVSSYAHSAYHVSHNALLVGRFTLAAQKTLEVQHQSQETCDTYGFGAAAGFTDEIYTVVEFWREA